MTVRTAGTTGNNAEDAVATGSAVTAGAAGTAATTRLTSADVKGILPASVTAFNEDESLNEAEVVNHAHRLTEAGVHGLFALGTNGEFYVLSTEERVRVVRLVVDAAAGRLPVYAGTGMIGTRESVEMARRLADAGASVLSVISPFFAAPSQDELVRHFETVADASPVPVLLYNIPARTGCSIAPATVARLSRHENIIGVKDSSGSFDNILQYLELTDRSELAVISGNDSLILWTLLAGGQGGISGIANIYPRTLVSIYERFRAGDLKGARQAQDSIRPIRNTLRYGNPSTVVKAATNFAGAPVGPSRAPFNMLPQEGLEAIRATVEADHARGLG